MFASSAPFPPFDHLRVPYTQTPGPADDDRVGCLWSVRDPSGGRLLWARAPGTPRRRAPRSVSGVFEVAGCRLAGEVCTVPPQQLLGEGDDSWAVLHEVRDAAGERCAAVSRNDRGDVFLPFDPGEVLACLRSERYRRLGRAAQVRSAVRTAAVHGYYRVRPVVPRSAQLALRRRLARRTPPTTDFPRWPLESGLDDLSHFLLGLCSVLAGEPVPWIAPWPDGADWCLVLTHDVETAQGCADLDLLREPERRAGFRSCWNFVPERYETPATVVEALRREGCEVGVHGLRHDGRDLASARVLRKRLPAMREAADRWGAVGFRSPATQRAWDLMPAMGFAYDSSYTDTDPYEPQPGGCCTWLPFFNGGLVELPITLPQDHTLFSILGHQDGSLWVDKARTLRGRGGMVLVLSHPDYAHGPALDAWEQLLEEFRGDPTMWQPLPRDVAAWWRERADSTVELRDGSWTVTGPAAGRGRVVATSADLQGAR